MFHVGQLVVCVDDSGHPKFGRPPLVEGRIYTVSHIEKIKSGIGLDLEESPCPRDDALYRQSRFRPLSETSISIFTAMLSPTKVDA
jgi:hypothetical protein